MSAMIPYTVNLAIIIRPGVSFNYFFILSLLLGVMYLFWIGHKRKYPMSTWSVFVFMIAVFFTLGLRIFSYSLHDLSNILLREYADISPVKYAPSAILFGLIGIFLGKRILGIKAALADDIILVLPLMGIIQRVGCFLNGCCYGIPSALPWAVKYTYPVYSHAHPVGQSTYDGLMIAQGVHPTQLYTILGYLMIFLFLVWVKHRMRRKGNLALLGLLLLVSLRFLMEFWRAAPLPHWYTAVWGGLNMLQWIIIATAGILLILIWLGEDKLRLGEATQASFRQNLIINSTIWLILLVVVWNMREILDIADILILMAICYFSLFTIIFHLIRRVLIPIQRLIILLTVSVAVVSMAQIRPDQYGAKRDTSEPVRGWFDIGIGLGAGNYDEITVHRNCYGDIISKEYVRRKYFVGNLNANYNIKPRINQHFKAGLSAYYFSDQTDEHQELDFSGFVIYPKFSYDFKIVGIGAGLHFPMVREKNYLYEYHNFNKVYPSFMLRIGHPKIFFFESGYYWDFDEMGIPAKVRMGFGSGFGKENVIFKIGFAGVSETGNLLFLSCEGLINDFLGVKFSMAIANNIHGSIGINYHFGKNRWVPRVNR